MLGLKKLFSPVKSIEAEEAKAFMERRPEGSYTLLDVRQPGEYEREHIPGSKLIPLPQLVDRKDEIDPRQPVLIY